MSFIFVLRRFNLLALLLFLALGLVFQPVLIHGADLPDIRRLLETGTALYQKGDMAGAAKMLSKALESAQNDPASLQIRRLLAAAWAQRGFFQKARRVLTDGLPACNRMDADPAARSRYLSQLGDLKISLGEALESLAILEKAEDLATVARDRISLAGILNNRGAALELTNNRQDAWFAYEEGIELLQGNKTVAAGRVRARLLLNQARFFMEDSRTDLARPLFDKAMETLIELPPDHDTGTGLIAIGALSPDAKQSFAAFKKAKEMGRELEDLALTASAAGRLGGVYSDAGRLEDALTLTREAVFLARQGRFPEQLYQWQQQMGLIHEALGNAEAAIPWLTRAVETLTPIRGKLMQDQRRRGAVFENQIRPVYLNLARVLIADAGNSLPGSARQAKLKAARTAMETLKTAELEDFFHDPCLADQAGGIRGFDTPPPGTAVAHPIVFKNQLAILLTLADGLHVRVVPIEKDRLEQAALRFRAFLQAPETGRRYFYYSRLLYDWLLTPLEDVLHEYHIKTLVTAPDGALRLIPFGALHNGERFVAQSFQVVTVPGVSLTALDAVQLADPQALLAGISESRQGFAPLPAVPEELRSIQTIMGGTVLLNNECTISNLKTAFSRTEYAVIHLATHGEFGSGKDATFLLTSEGRMTMDLLEKFIHIGRFRKNTVELLTLSACQTALGDARSALGLGGVAVKAGARSALATLWSVDDEATSLAVQTFYQEWRQSNVGKAQALQQAQTRLMTDETFQHPAFWAPFLLIGNWR